jgi:predicted nucleotidyltransferase
MASIDNCRWPDLQEPYLAALKAATAHVLSSFPTTTGIIAAGSILRGVANRSSDIDLYVIQHACFRQRIQRYFNHVPFEIFVNPPGMVRRYYREEVVSGRLITPHMLATGFVILQTDLVVSDLRKEAEAILHLDREKPADLTYSRYMAASILEDAIDVSDSDPATARFILNYAVEQMLWHVFNKACRFIPRMKDLLKELNILDGELGKLAARYYKEGSLNDQLDLAGQLADRIIEARGFFEWESDPEELTFDRGDTSD